ncbi:Nif3-like dinuclear metal center hexameric protein [Ferviditalea candida]|uniref:GTP cyclohydrolase 1 type 2 homolog n=1 Tax=Ferviditalea candida TaxID=3108399 RepID=A0ABU5ZIP2_9BACL|nr:Nif3-like dinuclear metal center hexameric protein [Paenibacillaceae bacterium T2]
MSIKKFDYTVASVLAALNEITRGRVVMDWEEVTAGRNPYVVMKTSNIPGKSVMEIPGLIFGSKDKPVRKIGVGMTLTESMIELASGIGLDLVIVHHPVADAANSGGVPLAGYLPLYNIALMELHEAFHGLHPGVAYLHGHRKLSTDINFCGVPGNILHVGVALDGIRTAGDMIRHLDRFMGREQERKLLEAERRIRGDIQMIETTLSNPNQILSGTPDSPVKHILHFFPHTGFSVHDLERALEMHPETDTIIASISRVREDHPLVQVARQRRLTFIVGNPHSVEILENGVPLAYAIQQILPGLEVFILRERVTASLLSQLGHKEIAEYGREMALGYLVPEGKEAKAGRGKTVTVVN